MEYGFLFITLSATLLFVLVRRLKSNRALQMIRGPPSPGFILGHQKIVQSQPQVGMLEKQWVQEFGTVWRLKKCLGALQYIYQKCGYHFPKSALFRQISREIAGEGILTAMGQDHARIRKVMNPAFSAGQIRSFLPVFHRSAQKMCEKWKELLQKTPGRAQRFDVNQWIVRCTSDIIGEAAFDMDFGALEDSFNPVLLTFKNMFAKSLPSPSAFDLLSQSLCGYLPTTLLRLVRYLPTKLHIHFRKSLDTINEYSKSLIEEKRASLLTGKAESKRDIMNILLRANTSEDPLKRLSEQEMISLMANLLLAGNDTTALSISWILYEVARHPGHQDTMRAEIMAARARATSRGDSDFSMGDLEAMSFVSAMIKESLRLNPIVYTVSRVSTRDEVVPLAYPIVTTSGEAVNEISVPSGTEIFVAIETYNRLPQVWGPDADTFNPYRFIEPATTDETFVGMTSNLLTFSAGLQGCIGWRFAIIEIQAILVELVENFVFALPEDKPKIVRLQSGVMTPVVEGERERGAQMPLCIYPVN